MTRHRSGTAEGSGAEDPAQGGFDLAAAIAVAVVLARPRGEHPQAHLAGWTGVLQADAYGGTSGRPCTRNGSGAWSLTTADRSYTTDHPPHCLREWRGCCRIG